MTYTKTPFSLLKFQFNSFYPAIIVFLVFAVATLLVPIYTFHVLTSSS